MGMKASAFLILLFLNYSAYHLYTLPLNPLPWFDETFFASISQSVIENGKLMPQISLEMWNGQENKVYGPVFFYLEATPLSVFGFGIFQYRIITFIFGLCTIAATWFLLKEYVSDTRMLMIAIIAFALDPFLNLSMHEGRMDLVSTFFMLGSTVCLVRGLKKTSSLYWFISGLFAVTALLTTPRSGIMFLGMCFTLFFYLINNPSKKLLLHCLLWLLPIISLYALWVFYAFGGPLELVHYYQYIRKTQTEYIGGRGYIPRHEIVIIPLTVAAMILGIFKQRKQYFNAGVLVSLLSIILFYLLVLDWGPYSALILPFYYFLFFYSLHVCRFQIEKRNPALYICLMLLIFNFTYFLLKASHILSEFSIRKPAISKDFVRKHIPPGSKVTGDAQYYYAVIQSGSDYRLYDVYMDLTNREKLLREVYDYDYLIISDRSLEKDPVLKDYFMQKATLVPVARLSTKQPPMAGFLGNLGLVSNAEKYGYSATIYYRLKNK
jgi:4-amino-4-deoxy-L-arabinose transferase-like glycosyltransferase